MIANGADPASARRAAKHKRNITKANPFKVIERESHAHMRSSCKENMSKNALQKLENDTFLAISSYLSPRSSRRRY
jgi:hypothetical protein